MATKARFNPAKMEIITPPQDRPGTKPSISTYIAQTKELSIENDKASFHNGIRIYTGGSGYKGTIGAAAILYNNGIKLGESSYQLGSEVEHDVFEGELMAVAKVGEVSNVAQVTQVCKGEMAERQSEETILTESLSYIDKNYSLLIVQVIKHM